MWLSGAVCGFVRVVWMCRFCVGVVLVFWGDIWEWILGWGGLVDFSTLCVFIFLLRV